MESRVTLTSQLGVEHLADLEELLYFNRQQSRTAEGIVRSIEEYGSPEVYAEQDLLRIRVGDLSGAQALYALEESETPQRLVGVMVYGRTTTESMVLLHIGVTEDYSAHGLHADAKLVMKMVLGLRGIARSIKGVNRVEIPYNPSGARIVSI